MACPLIMEKFTDDVLLCILKELDLNQRARFRLINKRCKDLLDSIQINKLVVFERLPPVPGRLDHTGEEYGLKDTAQVNDLAQFFSNDVLLKQMKLLETLVIRGVDEKVMSVKTEFEMKTAFEQLNYLSLHHVLVSSGQLLRSPKIQYLILDGCALRSKVQIKAKIEELKSRPDASEESLSAYMYALTDLESRNLRYLKVTLETEYYFYLYLKQNELLRSIEELDVVISDFASLEFIIENFASLKRLHCLIGTDKCTLLKRAQVDLESLANKLRDDQSVFICGIPFRRSAASLVIEFLKKAGDMVKIEDAKLEFTGFSGTYEMLEKFEKRVDLGQFYKKIDRFKVHDTRSMNAELFARFSNCKALDIAVHHNPEPLIKFFEAFPTIKAIRISCFDWLVKIDNELLDKIPAHCGQIEQLSFDNWNKKINFTFLLELKRLRKLECNLYLPMEQSLFLALIKYLKHIESIDVCFMRPNDVQMNWLSEFRREKLSAFKRQVNDYVQEKLQAADHFMKIQEFYKEKSEQKELIRYLYKRGKSALRHRDGEAEWAAKSDAMFMLVDYRKQINEEIKKRRSRLGASI